MRGRWAAGIVPRNFNWIIRDQLAVSERPGGYAPNHRRVRRQEEILWLRAQGFTRVVSLLGSTHNLHAYDEFKVTWSHYPIAPGADVREVLADLYPDLITWLRAGEKVLVHQEELGDRLMGVMAGYLRWAGLLPEGPRAITAVELIVRKQMGTVGRGIVAAVDDLPPAPPAEKVDHHLGEASADSTGRAGTAGRAQASGAAGAAGAAQPAGAAPAAASGAPDPAS